MFVYWQPNPRISINQTNSTSVPATRGDCVVRALSKILNKSWEDMYLELTAHAFMFGDLFSANYVWISYLLEHGFIEHSLISLCKDCYTLERFAKDVGPGKYVVSDGNHAVAVIRKANDKEADFYDSWNSKYMVPIFYLEKVDIKDVKNGGVGNGNE